MPLIQISPISQLHLQASHIHPLDLLNCGTTQDMSLRLADCSTVVMIDRLPLLTKVFPITLTGQISYVEEEVGVVFGPADQGRVNMTSITRKIALPVYHCILQVIYLSPHLSVCSPFNSVSRVSQSPVSIISPHLSIIWPKHLRII